MRRIDAAIDANSYINNSSVAKTAMQKRRNIPLGAVGGHPNLHDGGIMTVPSSIMDPSLTPNNYHDASDFDFKRGTGMNRSGLDSAHGS